MYKMLVLDFDDTLLSEDLTISSKNIEALRKAKDQGVHVVFCSGRSDDSMMKYIEEVGLFDDEEYFISYNGAKIDQINGKNVFHKWIENPILSDLIRIGKEVQIDVQLYSDGLVIDQETEFTKRYIELTSCKYKLIDNLYQVNSSVKVLFNSSRIDELNRIKEKIEKQFPNELHVFFSKPTYVEVLNREANKGLAVQELAKILGIKREEIIAVGDSFNDLYMIEYAGLGVAVANAAKAIQEAADYVTKADHNHDAVAEVVDKFLLY